MKRNPRIIHRYLSDYVCSSPGANGNALASSSPLELEALPPRWGLPASGSQWAADRPSHLFCSSLCPFGLSCFFPNPYLSISIFSGLSPCTCLYPFPSSDCGPGVPFNGAFSSSGPWICDDVCVTCFCFCCFSFCACAYFYVFYHLLI